MQFGKVNAKVIKDELIRYLIKDRLASNRIESPNLRRLVLGEYVNFVMFVQFLTLLFFHLVCLEQWNQPTKRHNESNQTNGNEYFMTRKTASKRVDVCIVFFLILFQLFVISRQFSLQELYMKHLEHLKKYFDNQPYVSSTIDIWSCKARSFLGVSAHYIDPTNFELKNFLIACELFEGDHSALNTTEKLKTIYARFGLTNKISATTTDNAGEFKASFKYYGKNHADCESHLDDREIDWSNDHNYLDVELNTSESEMQQIVPVPDDLENIDFCPREQSVEDDIELHPILDDHLPNRVECSAHGLNWVAKTDAYKALEKVAYATFYCMAFKKLNRLWHFASCRKSSEIIIKYLDRAIVRPNQTRWNSIYDSVSFFDFIILVPQIRPHNN